MLTRRLYWIFFGLDVSIHMRSSFSANIDIKKTKPFFCFFVYTHSCTLWHDCSLLEVCLAQQSCTSCSAAVRNLNVSWPHIFQHTAAFDYKCFLWLNSVIYMYIRRNGGATRELSTETDAYRQTCVRKKIKLISKNIQSVTSCAFTCSCVASGLPPLNVQSLCFVHVLFKQKSAYSISAMQGLDHCCLV